MAPTYRSLEDGQLVISDEPREDLEALARWQQLSDEEAADADADTPAEIIAEPADGAESEQPAKASRGRRKAADA